MRLEFVKEKRWFSLPTVSGRSVAVNVLYIEQPRGLILFRIVPNLPMHCSGNGDRRMVIVEVCHDRVES